MAGPALEKIFKIGEIYKAKKTFMSGPTVFVAGETLRFELDYFGHWDDANVYQFHSETDGQTKTWWLFLGLSPNDPSTDWRQHFELIGFRQ